MGMKNRCSVLKSVLVVAAWLLPVGCHSSPPPSPAPAPSPPPPVVDSEPEIPEVVGHQIDLTGANFTGCEHYEEAAEKIWSYRIQADLNLAVKIYEGKIVAGDAENLIRLLDEFSSEWKNRFRTLCENAQKNYLAPGQYEAATRCLSDLLDRQKDYVNSLFHETNFVVEEAGSLNEHLGNCDDALVPRGEKSMKNNPF
jgi:hypothetical protein